MIVTGFIEHIIPFSYSKNGKQYRKKHILVRYPFYNQMNFILFIANENLEVPVSSDLQYIFEFDITTKYHKEKIFTDFYLNKVRISPIIDAESKFQLSVVDTNVVKKEIQILRKEQVKGRIKCIASLLTADAKLIYVYFWEDNHFLEDLDQAEHLQLNCRSLEYKNKHISNVEIWRSGVNDDFLGSIIV